MQGSIRFVDPQSQTVVELSGDIADVNFAQNIDNAIRIQKMIPIRNDNSPIRVQEFMGGLLFDGVPIGVFMGGPWLSGQREVLAPLINAGKIPAPPPEVWNRGEVPMSPQVMDATARFNQSHPAAVTPADYVPQSEMIAGVPNWMLLAGAGLALWYFMGSGPGRGGGSSQMDLGF